MGTKTHHCLTLLCTWCEYKHMQFLAFIPVMLRYLLHNKWLLTDMLCFKVCHIPVFHQLMSSDTSTDDPRITPDTNTHTHLTHRDLFLSFKLSWGGVGVAVWSHQGASLFKSPRSFFLIKAEHFYNGEIIGPSLCGIAPAVTENVTP